MITNYNFERKQARN